MKKFTIVQCATGFILANESVSQVSVIASNSGLSHPAAPQPQLQGGSASFAPPPPPPSPWAATNNPMAYSTIEEVFAYIADSLKPPEAIPYMGDAESVLRYAKKHCEPKDIGEFLAAYENRDMAKLAPYLEWLNG